MKVIIDISEELYDCIATKYRGSIRDFQDTCAAIREGIPLSEGHGKIIDVNNLPIRDISLDSNYHQYGVTKEDIDKVLPIVDEDKVEASTKAKETKDLPEPTEKQLSYAHDIASWLDIALPREYTKKAYSNFISRNVNRYKKTRMGSYFDDPELGYDYGTAPEDIGL